MPPAADRTRPRRTADERRRALVEAAHRHFARGGLHGTPVSEITKEVGITQPYAFSLFGTKKDLFLAACTHNSDRVVATFRAAAEHLPREQRAEAMGRAYVELLEDREVLRMQLQSQAACDDPEVREHVRAGYQRVRDAVVELTGMDEHELMAFVATGMYLNLIASVDAPEWMPQDGPPGEAACAPPDPG